MQLSSSLGFLAKGARSSKWALGLVTLIALAAPSLSAHAAALATAVAVKQEATGQFDGTISTLVVDAELLEGQLIATGPGGQVQVVFADDTHLVVGPGSSLRIEKYLMQGGGTAADFAVSALGGSFRFITGHSEKSAYEITTPTGTIGIRGTEFDFTVDEVSGETSVIVFKGQVLLCPKTGACATLSQHCEIGLVAHGKDAELLNAAGEGRNDVASGFPYVRSEQPLRRDFRIKGADGCLDPPLITASIKSAPPEPGPVVEPPPVPEPEPGPPPPVVEQHNNNGHGNGGEGSEGDYEQGNPGHHQGAPKHVGNGRGHND